MQLAIIEFARNAVGLEGVNSTEMDCNPKHPIIDYLPEKYSFRLGEYECKIKENTIAFNAYKTKTIFERHRHRYEFNNKYKDILEKHGLIFSGINPQNNLVEIIELKDHPYFIGCQFHPEFISRPNRAHPLFKEFIKNAIK